MKSATDGHDAGISDFVFAKLMVSSPRKLSILVVQNNIHRIKASQKNGCLILKKASLVTVPLQHVQAVANAFFLICWPVWDCD